MQDSNFDHPVLNQKLWARFIVLEGRGSGWDGGAVGGKQIKEVTTELFTMFDNSVVIQFKLIADEKIGFMRKLKTKRNYSPSAN